MRECLPRAPAWAKVFEAPAHDPQMQKLKHGGRSSRRFWFKTAIADGWRRARRALSYLKPSAQRQRALDRLRRAILLIVRTIQSGAYDAHTTPYVRRASRDETYEAVKAVTEGLHLISVADITLLEDRRFSFTGHDPRMQFAVSPNIANTAVVEMTFGVLGARRAAMGRLYIDYGGGFSEGTAIALTPRGRDEYSAFIVSPKEVVKLRWDPDAVQDLVEITHVRARGLSRSELKARQSVQNSTLDFGYVFDGLSQLGGAESPLPACFVMSDRLTQMIGAHGAYGAEAGQGDYKRWIATNELRDEAVLKDRLARLAAVEVRPIISILMRTLNASAHRLRETIDSVLAQAYGDWELHIVDDVSSQLPVRDLLDGYAAADPRIRIRLCETNGKMAQSRNTGLKLANGDWLTTLHPGDLLSPDALLCTSEAISARPEAVLIYSDEDEIDERGERSSPFFKPDYSPIQLLAQNYLNHLTVYQTERVRTVGGWRSEFDGSEDYDLNLRVITDVSPSQVLHIPKVLYHRRAAKGFIAHNSSEKSEAEIQPAQRAVAAHFERTGQKAEVTLAPGRNSIRVRHALPQPAPLVSVIIPTRDRADLLKMCVESVVARTTYVNYEIIVVDNDSVERETFNLFKRLGQNTRIRVIPHPGPFNFSAINNAAVAQCRSELVCLLNNDIEVIAADWMGEMASWAIQPEIGCVGAKLYYPDDTVQHAGVILGIGSVAGHCHKHFRRESLGYFGRLAMHHDVSAVTGACLMVRRSVYEAVSGLDPLLRVAFNDVDFCLKVREAGYWNVFTPYAELYHHESLSRGAEDNPKKLSRFNAEAAIIRDRWGEKLKIDPFYSMHLTTELEDYSLKL